MPSARESSRRAPVVLYDHREERSGVPAALAAAGVAVEPERLPVGDYVLSARLVVERKSPTDLAASSRTDGCSSRSTGSGRPIRPSSSSWRACPSTSPNDPGRGHSAGSSWRGSPCCGPKADGRRRPNRRRRPFRCLPGVSTVGARRLLTHFGSLAAVFAADEAALRDVPGIGPIRGAALARLFRAS